MSLEEDKTCLAQFLLPLPLRNQQKSACNLLSSFVPYILGGQTYPCRKKEEKDIEVISYHEKERIWYIGLKSKIWKTNGIWESQRYLYSS